MKRIKILYDVMRNRTICYKTQTTQDLNVESDYTEQIIKQLQSLGNLIIAKVINQDNNMDAPTQSELMQIV